MPRGRPKGSKNKSKDIEITTSKIDIFEEKEPNKNVSVTEIISTIETIKPKAQCDLCGDSIYSQGNYINLNILTSKATWHRNCNKDRLCLCNNCAKELNNLIDTFILQKNPKLNKWSA